MSLGNSAYHEKGRTLEAQYKPTVRRRMHLEYSWQPCEQPPTYPTKRDGWAGGKISKNCPVGRNKITTEWLDIWSWELCKLVKSLHTTPGHPKHQLSWGKNCWPALFQVYSHVTLLKLHFATFEIIIAVYWENWTILSVVKTLRVVALWYFWVTLFFCFCY